MIRVLKLLLARLLPILCATALVVGQTTPVKLLVLAPWPSDRDDAGWDAGLDSLAGGRVAVKEINNTTDLLRDHHIELVVPEYGHEPCGFVETSQGILNLLQNSIHPPGEVLAVLGLFCSTSTKEISSLAGRESVQLIQLSASNSPIFHPDNITLRDTTLQPTYPHLWQFLASASIYADIMIELMARFDWKDIVIIYVVDDRYFAGIANALTNRVPNSILLRSSSNELFHDNTLDQIQQRGRIIFVSAPPTQMHVADLLCRAAKRQMFYPDYMWILTDLQSFSLDNATSLCDPAMLHHALPPRSLPPKPPVASFNPPRLLGSSLRR